MLRRQACWSQLVIPTLGGKDRRIKNSRLGYIARPCLKTSKQKFTLGNNLHLGNNSQNRNAIRKEFTK
jgi:hypothetical protein